METIYAILESLIGWLVLLIFIIAIVWLALKLRSKIKLAKRYKLKFDLLQELTDGYPINSSFISLVKQIPFPFPEIDYFQSKIILYYQKNKTVYDIGYCLSGISNSGLTPEKRQILGFCLERSVLPNSDVAQCNHLIVILVEAIKINASADQAHSDSEIMQPGIDFIIKIVSNKGGDFTKLFCWELDKETETLLKGEGIDPGQKKLIEAELVKIHRLLD